MTTPRECQPDAGSVRGLGAVRLMARVSGGQRGAQLEFLEAVGRGIQRTLRRVVGTAAPIEPLLEAALLRAVNHAPDYAGDEPLALWAQSIAVQVATTYLADPARTSPGSTEPSAAGNPKLADLLSHVHTRLRQMRPEEQVAFALLELDGRSLGEASRLMRASPMVVRQRASRVRRYLLFVARRDRRVAIYLRLGDPLRKLAARLHRLRLHSLGEDSLRRAQGRVVQILQPEPQHP